MLYTARLRLRLLDAGEPAHAALYRDLYTCPQVMHRIMPPLAREAAEAAFGRACIHNLRASPGHRFWAIETRGTWSGLGLAALQRSGSRAEFGAMLLPDAWNRGVARDVLRAVLVHAFDDLGLDVVDACSREDDGLPVIERLLTPPGFERRHDSPPGTGRWELTRLRWRTRADAGVVGCQSASG